MGNTHDEGLLRSDLKALSKNIKHNALSNIAECNTVTMRC